MNADEASKFRPPEMAHVFMDSAQEAEIHYKVSGIIYGSSFGRKDL